MTETSYWAVIPAAGTGLRMGSAKPKQYLPLAGKTVLEWAIAPFLSDPRCQAVVIVISSNDEYWPGVALSHSKLRVTQGGRERVHSVLAGLHSLHDAQQDDWVLVHDAARPCLHVDDIEKLLSETCNDSVGGILATPLSDTLKLADTGQRIARTIPRVDLWRALTPQMFRLGMLQAALHTAIESGSIVTDESAALEVKGLQPKLVAGRSDNLKITVPEDLPLAASVLMARTRQS